MNLLDQKLIEIEKEKTRLEIEKTKILCAKMLTQDFFCVEKSVWDYAQVMDIDDGVDLLNAVSDIADARKAVMFYVEHIQYLKTKLSQEFY